MDLQPVFYNTLTKRNEVFTSRSPNTVKLFTCGPSVYRKPHLGNFRTFLFEDILQKYLEYLGYRVERIINFTDLEDKTIRQAEDDDASIHEVTEPVADYFHDKCSELGIYLPDKIPRSTTSVKQSVKLIQMLLEKGVAYWHKGNVYFDPLKHEGFGAVYGLDMSKWPKKRYRFSKDTYTGHRWNLGDFILWHGNNKGNGMHWDTEIGKGRPSWNVQDAAMITQTLGYQIDIHMGGIDNIYRHHDYNRAIVESASGKDFCPYWVHGEHLIVNGEKMSKSKGNTLYAEDMYKKGYSPKRIRFFLSYGYYRDKLNVTPSFLENASKQHEKLQHLASALTTGKADAVNADPYIDKLISEISILFSVKMHDNLRIKDAVDSLVAIIGQLEKYRKKEGISPGQQTRIRTNLEHIDNVLGFIFK